MLPIFKEFSKWISPEMNLPEITSVNDIVKELRRLISSSLERTNVQSSLSQSNYQRIEKDNQVHIYIFFRSFSKPSFFLFSLLFFSNQNYFYVIKLANIHTL